MRSLDADDDLDFSCGALGRQRPRAPMRPRLPGPPSAASTSPVCAHDSSASRCPTSRRPLWCAICRRPKKNARSPAGVSSMGGEFVVRRSPHGGPCRSTSDRPRAARMEVFLRARSSSTMCAQCVAPCTPTSSFVDVTISAASRACDVGIVAAAPFTQRRSSTGPLFVVCVCRPTIRLVCRSSAPSAHLPCPTGARRG